MCREAGLWRSGNKRALAAGLNRSLAVKPDGSPWADKNLSSREIGAALIKIRKKTFDRLWKLWFL